MAWSIENGVFLGRGIELSSSNLNGFSLLSFLVTSVHYVSQPPGISSGLYGFLLIFINSSLINDSIEIHQITTNSRFTSINVTDEDHGAWLSNRINFNQTIWGHVHRQVFESFAQFFFFDFGIGFSNNTFCNSCSFQLLLFVQFSLSKFLSFFNLISLGYLFVWF